MKFGLSGLVLFLGLLAFPCFSSVPVARFNDGWMVYNSSYRSYVPYLPGGEAPKVLYYSLKPNKFRNDTLQFMAYKGLCLYLEYRLIYQNTQGEMQIKIPVRKLASGVSSDSVILAFYDTHGLVPDRLDAQIMTSGKVASRQSLTSGRFVQVRLREGNAWNEMLLFSTLLVLLLLSFSKMAFPENTDFMQLIGVSSSGKLLVSSYFISGLQAVRILINSICIAAFLYFIAQALPPHALAGGLSWIGLNYWKIVFWSIFIHILKFTYNYLCANFSHMTSLLHNQNAAFVNVFYVANLTLLVLLIACNFSPAVAAWVVQYHVQIIVFYLVIPELLLSLNIIRASGLRNVYLFSYICTAEILPLLVALKFLP